MAPRFFLVLLEAAGVRPTLRDGRIWVASHEVSEEIDAFLRKHRAAIVAELEAEGGDAGHVPAAEPAASVVTGASPDGPWWTAPGWSVEAWLAEVERETGARVTWDGERVRIVPKYASGYVPPWVCSEAWTIRTEIESHFRARAAVPAVDGADTTDSRPRAA